METEEVAGADSGVVSALFETLEEVRKSCQVNIHMRSHVGVFSPSVSGVVTPRYALYCDQLCIKS